VPKPPKKTDKTGHVVLVGYGRVGSLVGQDLLAAGEQFVAIEASDDAVALLQKSGIETFSGNAAAGEVLKAANIAQAASVIIAIPEAFEAGQVVEQARLANPGIRIIARAHSDDEVNHLTDLGADTVIMGEREIARGMLEEFTSWRQKNRTQ
jgi:CPA2 family monovalent cation:H+ antiporter-2